MLKIDKCYDYFGVNINTSFDEIQKIYKKKAKLLHPDLNQDIDTTKEFQELNEYFQYLKIHHNEQAFKQDGEWTDLNYGFKVKFGFGEKIDTKKYATNIINLTCNCPDWRGNRNHFSINDPRRLCKHLIASFEINKTKYITNSIKFDFSSFIIYKNNILNVPNNLGMYCKSIYEEYKILKGFDLYWNEKSFFGKNIVIFYKIKQTGCSRAIIYLKSDFEISVELYYTDNIYFDESRALSNNTVERFVRFCTEEIFTEIKTFFSKFNIWNVAYKKLEEYFYKDYSKFGRKIIVVDSVVSEKDNYLISSNYNDNLLLLIDSYYEKEIVNTRDYCLSEYDEIKNLIRKFNLTINTGELNKIFNKMGVIVKDPKYNLNKWILSKEYEEYGINLLRTSYYIHSEIPSWYKVHYFDIYELKLFELKEIKNIGCTNLLFKVDNFIELYNKAIKYNLEIKKEKTKLKKISVKQVERESWLRHVTCSNCGEKNNIHKKDKRKRNYGYIQRFYCNECNSVFQMNVDDLEKKIQEYENTKSEGIEKEDRHPSFRHFF
jgi:curved DNA-binding protein CbpA/transcription elongation factor Elf1